MLQSYKHPFAVYEYFGNYFQTFFSMVTNDDDNVVIWSFGHLSKSKTDAVKTVTINKKYIFIYSEQNNHFPKSKMTNDQMTK